MLSPEKLWKHVVTEYQVGGHSFKIMRANGDKQPTDIPALTSPTPGRGLTVGKNAVMQSL